jgi:hypothetical protein
MAGGWIKMSKGLWDHPKIVRTASALNADRAWTVGAYFHLWSIADEHTTDGRLEGYSAAAVDDAVGKEGFARAAEAAGWLVVEPEAVVIPRFENHNGQCAKRRAQESDRKRDVRKSSAPDADTKRPRSDQIRADITIDRSNDRPTEGGACDADKYRTLPVDDLLWDRLRQQLNAAAAIARNGSTKPLSDRNRASVIRCVLLADRFLAAGEADAILSRVKEAIRRGETRKPPAYLQQAFINACEAQSPRVDFHRAANAFEIPAHRLSPPAPTSAADNNDPAIQEDAA